MLSSADDPKSFKIFGRLRRHSWRGESLCPRWLADAVCSVRSRFYLTGVVFLLLSHDRTRPDGDERLKISETRFQL